MPVVQCTCGARYKVSEESAGRKVRCRKCGKTFRIPDGQADSASPADEFDLAAMANAEAKAPTHQSPAAPAETASGSMFDRSDVSTAHDPGTPRSSHLPRTRPRVGFWADVGWTLIFFTTPSNMIMFGIIWILHFVALMAGFAPFFGWLASLFVTMFIISWYMSIIAETASGEDELPKFSVSGGYWDDVCIPAAQYAGSWLMLLAPAIIYYVMLSLGGFGSTLLLLNALYNPYGFVVSGDGDPLLVALVVLALFLWPMALMCASMGGLTTLVRIDLIAVTIAKTFLPYALISLLVTASVVLPELITVTFATAKTGTGSGLGTDVVILAISFALKIYFSIVMTRLIGLYYRHFKLRFAWDWE